VKTGGAAEEDEIIAAKMKFLSKEINSLKSFVEEYNLERKSAKWEITEDIKDFTFLGEQELRNITCGVYQLKLSPSYIQEYLDGESQILIHKEDPGLIRVKIHSRHISSAWYCKCRAGARVVGVCSHIASVLWYLGFARHNEKQLYGVRNWGEFVEDAQQVDNSDSESESSTIEE
jgi:hypothetical protein